MSAQEDNAVLVLLLLHLITLDDPPEALVVEDRYGNDVILVPAAPEPGGRTPPPSVKPAAPPPRCSDGMVYVPGGTLHRKRFSAFCLDIHEVTVGAVETYLRSLDEDPNVTKASVDTRRSALRKEEWPGVVNSSERSALCTWNQRSKSPELPVNCISHAEADAFCAAQGKRLPTEREWQWAARGGRKASTYPWGGGRPSPERLNMGQPGQQPKLVLVGSYNASAGGLHDLSGNVAEWTAADPASATCNARGGSFRSLNEKAVKVTAVVTAHSRQARSDEIGFRCAATPRTTERAR